MRGCRKITESCIREDFNKREVNRQSDKSFKIRKSVLSPFEGNLSTLNKEVQLHLYLFIVDFHSLAIEDK